MVGSITECHCFLTRPGGLILLRRLELHSTAVQGVEEPESDSDDVGVAQLDSADRSVATGLAACTWRWSKEDPTTVHRYQIWAMG